MDASMKKITIVLALICTSFGAYAQEMLTPTRSTTNDFRGRVEGAVEWEVVDDLTLEAAVQLRLNNDLGSVDRIQTGVGANYRVNKYFDFGADYILINGYESDVKSWDKPRHRANVNVRGTVKVGRVELSLRERLQTTFRTDSVNRYEKMNPELVLRSRLMAEYSLRHSRWSPYALFEMNNTLNAPQVVANYKSEVLRTDNYITRYRLGVGAKFRISRYHRLDFYYYFDYDRGYNIDYKGNSGALKGYVQENEFRHTFGISYKFKL